MAFILVADNSPFYRELLGDALQARGHEVQAVSDGLEALQAIESRRPDAVVLDLVMPKVSGARACRQIKSSPATESIPVIILSGLRQDEIDDQEGIGADAYVAKMQAEQMVDHLAAALEEVLSGKPASPMRGFDGMHRREVVSELLEERRSRDAILSSLTEGYIRVAEDERIIEANLAALKMLGLGEAEVVNRRVAEILRCPEPTMSRLLRQRSEAGELRLVVGDRLLKATLRAPVQPDYSRDYFVLLTDVTEEERADQHRRDLEAMVQASARMSALGEILAGVAHELNNPLTGILGYAELLLRLAPDERTRSRLERLNHEALRCRRIVENLLCFARQRHAYKRAQNINTLVLKVMAAHGPAAEKARVQMAQQLADGLPDALFDFGQLEQVLTNLLANAFQALQACPEAQRQVRVRTLATADRIVLEVEDSGPGIPEASRERVFEPFFTTHRHEGGTGLGLAVSYGIVEEHGGRIAVVPTSSGARLRVEIPLAAAAEDDLEDAQPQAEVDERLPAVLIVDDEPVVLDLIEDVLNDSGFRVHRASNGAQALERLAESSFAAVLIDMKMPDMDGHRLFEIIRERQPEMASRVVFTTGNLDNPAVTRFLKETGNRLLLKPFQLEEVAATFRDVVERGNS